MKVFDLPAEYHLGSAEAADMDIDNAQAMASTLDEKQDEDPVVSDAEKAYIHRLLGFDPSSWDEDESEPPADAGSKKKGGGPGPEARDAGERAGGVLDQALTALAERTSAALVHPVRRGGLPITRKQLHDLHVKRHTLNEKRMAKVLAGYFSGVVTDTCKALVKNGGTITAEQAEKPEATAKKLLGRAFDEDAALEGLVASIKDPMAKAFFDGAMTEYHLGKRAHKAIVERMQTKHLEGQHDQQTHGREGGADNDAKIRNAQIDTPEFKAWFGDSKVIDENGDPLVVYHGTGGHGASGAASGIGVVDKFHDESHFTTSRKAAERIAGDTGRVVAVYLSIQNPKRIDDVGANWGDLVLDAMEEGYDGFVYANEYEGGGDSYMTFFNTQIKSATSNVGTFDPDDPDITKSVKSAASELLQELGLDMPEGMGGLEFGTEVPGWLIAEATDAMVAAFEEPYWQAIIEGTRDDLMGTLQHAIREGVDMRTLAAEIKEIRGPDYAWWRARNTARTETGWMLNRGAAAGIKQTSEETGLPMGKEWNSVFGSTSRQNHMDFDATATETPDGMFSFPAQDGETYEIEAPSDPKLPAEDRCNCLLGSAIVSGEFTGAMRARYKGRMTEIVTRTGRRLTLSPNHPVVTAKGLVGAGQIQPGDQVLTYKSQINRSPNVRSSCDQVENKPAFIEEVFEAFSQGAIVSSCDIEVRSAQVVDFHGDGQAMQGDVEVVRADWKLLQDMESCRCQKRGNAIFVFPFLDSTEELSDGTSSLAFNRLDRSTTCVPGGGQKLVREGIPIAKITPTGTLAVGVGPQIETSLTDSLAECGPAVTSFLREALERYPGSVAFDDVVQVRDFQTECHVFDLQSKYGLIVARDAYSLHAGAGQDNGIVISNCQCFMVSTIVSGELSPDEEPDGEEGPPEEAGVSALDRKLTEYVEDEKRRDGVWRGPVSTPHYHALLARVREGHERCSGCGSAEQLLVHHVDGDGRNDAEENLQVLCDACHRAMPDGPHARAGEKHLEGQHDQGTHAGDRAGAEGSESMVAQ